jgi:hypothetical protein
LSKDAAEEILRERFSLDKILFGGKCTD